MKTLLHRFAQAPILTASAVSFILGIVIASIFTIPFFLEWLFCLVMLPLVFLARRTEREFALFLLLLCFGLGALHTRNYLYFPYNHIGSLNLQKSQRVELIGIIENDPAINKSKGSFILRVNKIGIKGKVYAAQGEVLANVFNGAQLRYGDELRLEGNLYQPFSFSRRVFSYRDYLRHQGIFYICNVRKEDSVVVLERGKGTQLKSFALRLKHKLKGIFDEYLWPYNSRVLSGIILGERQNFPQDIRRAFIQTGTGHIIAISGFNVGIVAFIALILLKALGIKRKARYGITIPLLILHMYAVGLSASVVRATIMAVVVLIAYLIEREPHIINNLSLAALVILGYNPLQLFDVGFQLSFVSVLGIVLLSPGIGSFLSKGWLSRGEAPFPAVAESRQKRETGFRLVKGLINSFSVSFSAWIVTSGFIAYYFRIVSPVSVCANLIIVPFTSLIITLGFSLGISALVFPLLAPSIAITTNYALGALFTITHWLSSVPFAYFYLPT